MFHVVNTYTRTVAMMGLSAESSFRLQRVRGEVLGMLRQLDGVPIRAGCGIQTNSKMADFWKLEKVF